MYDVYISRYQNGNSIVNTEKLMFSVPAENGFPIKKPVVKADEDAAETFSFTMESNSPYYDALLQLKTMIRVVYDGDVIFYGRVLSVNDSTIYNTRNVKCEGYFAFLNDSYYEGVPEKNLNSITPSAYFSKIINNHNDYVPSKSINRGTVDFTLPTKADKYEPTAWTQSSSLISNMTSNFGGHIHVRYSGTTAYLDWYKYYTRDLGNNARPTVTVGKNILDISSESTADQIFTRVIPIGDSDSNGKTVYIDGYKYDGTHTYSGKAMPVSFIRNLYTDSQLTDEFHDYTDYRDAESKFGVIYKTMTFSNCDTQPKLWNEVKAWIKDSYFGIVTSFSIKAIDMHVLDGNYPKILIGECVDVKFPVNRNGSITWYTKKLICKSISYDLFNPENNTYTFGIPSDVLEYNRHNRKKSSTKKTSSQVNAPAPVVPSSRANDDNWTWKSIWKLIGDRASKQYYADFNADYDGTNPAISFYNNGEISATATVYDPDEVIDSAGNTIGNNYMDHKDRWFKANIVGKITLSGKSVKWVAYSIAHGIFAFESGSDPQRIKHWYSKKKGTKYVPGNGGLSSFEKIAKMIETDPDATYGGSSKATSFRNNGKMSGSVNCYDPTKTNNPSSHPEAIFTAQIVGRFGSNPIKYVAISNEYGVFAYTKSAQYQYYPEEVKHWYMSGSGVIYNDTKGLLFEEGTPNKDTSLYTTNDGSMEGDKTIFFKPTVLTGQGSQGEALIGYDLTTSGDKWKIGLNLPIQYTDKNGNTAIADGFVKASDFNIDTIPSFKTKLLIADIIIAGKVNATELAAERAYINKLRSDAIDSNTYVNASAVYANTMSALKQIMSKKYLLTVDGENDVRNMGYCFSSCRVWPGTGSGGKNDEKGKIYFEFGCINGDTNGKQTVNFNIADTQAYKDAVSAATTAGRAAGWSACYDNIGLNFSSEQFVYPVSGNGGSKWVYPISKSIETAQNPTIIASKGVKISAKPAYVQLDKTTSGLPSSADKYLNPGEWVKARVRYSDKDGTVQYVDSTVKWVQANTDSDLVAKNIKKGVTIFGVAGSYDPSPSIAKDDLQVGSYNNVSTRPDADVEAQSMHDTIIAAIKLCNWFRFKVYCNGTNAEKYYRMHFTTADKNAIKNS